MITGELNIDTADQTKDTCTYLSDLRDTFSLTNIINDKACYKARKGTSIDVLLTNRPGKFHKTSIFEAGISDHHRLTPKQVLVIITPCISFLLYTYST